MHIWTSWSALLAGLPLVAAQFSFPVKSTTLKPGERCQIKWNTEGLQGPLSINLVPTDSLGSGIVAQRIAVEVENTGVLAWAPDLSIAAFSSFSMVIVDSRAIIVTSEAFVIGSLIQKPAQITVQVPQLATLTSKDGRGQVVTRTVTADVKNTVVASPTGAIKIHQSGTKVLDSTVSAEATNTIGSDGLKQLPAFAGGGDVNQGGALQPLPNVSAGGSQQATTTTAREQRKNKKKTKTRKNKGAKQTQKSAPGTTKPAEGAASPTSSSAAAQITTSADKAVEPIQTTSSAAAPPKRRADGSTSDEAAAFDPSSPSAGDKLKREVQAADISLQPLPGVVTTAASLESPAPRPSFTTLSDLKLSPSPVKATGGPGSSGSSAMSSDAFGRRTAPGVLVGMAGLAALAAAVVL